MTEKVLQTNLGICALSNMGFLVSQKLIRSIRDQEATVDYL
jgi:hypothetical protein